MLLEKERQLVVEYGKKLITSGLTTGTGGNVSVLNRDAGLFAISPSGMDYFETTVEDIVVLDLDGNIVDGDRKPSSEVDLHRIFFVKRSDIDSVIHTHSIFSTTLATLRWELPAANYYIAIAGGNNVRVSDYAEFGTPELAKTAYEAMTDRYACFLANHGLLAAGATIQKAFTVAEEVERQAEVYIRAKNLGEPVLLTDDEVDVMLKKFSNYGQQDE